MYFKPDVSEADKWVPTKKGINLDVDMWSDFKELVGKVDEALGKGGGIIQGQGRYLISNFLLGLEKIFAPLALDYPYGSLSA